MAAGVAHDLKNVLNPMSMHLQVLERAQKNGKADLAREEIAEMKAVLQRGVRTIDRLRDYGRHESESPATEYELGPAIEEAIAIAKPRLASKSGAMPRIVADIGGTLRVLGHREEVVSAVVNLIINAIDALSDRGGTITVRAVEDDGSVIRVEDTGPGMPPEVERRAFEPFFTTKGDEGTGLGLAMVYACMRRHAGSVTLETGEGTGTKFTLRFPRRV
jgi:signal transduction histidine kinase